MAEDVRGLTIGSEITFEKQITEELVAGFVQVSGDTNPLHSDPAYAARTRFKRPIAHGMISAGFISAALATKLAPRNVVVYLSQSLQFRAPVYIGDTLTVTCTVKAVDPARSRATVETIVANQDGTQVIRGEAGVLVEALED